jgi:death-on-curing protein
VKQWRWLQADDLVAMHGELIAEFGGPPGLRDRALLESAAARPKHLATYERPGAFERAAAYAFGLARNHPFIDGNKRVALVAAFTFLELNGWEVDAEEAAAVLVFLDLATGKLDEKQLAVWLEGNSQVSAGDGS